MYFVLLQTTLFFLLTTGINARNVISDALEETLETGTDSSPKRDYRWSFFYMLEKQCTRICQDAGKPYGRQQGQLCQCYCPIIAPEWTLCAGTFPSCDNFCRAKSFRLGGDCVHGDEQCYCFCTPREFYIASQIYSKPAQDPNPHILSWPFPLIDDDDKFFLNKEQFTEEEDSKPSDGVIHTPQIVIISPNVKNVTLPAGDTTMEESHYNASTNVPISNPPEFAHIPEMSNSDSDTDHEADLLEEGYVY